MDYQPGLSYHGGCTQCNDLGVVVRELVTPENVAELFVKHEVPKELTLLVLDTDMYDYWILKALLEDGRFRARLIAVDFNPDFALQEAYAVRHRPDLDGYEWDGSRYTSASLLAYTRLLNNHGYEYVYSMEMGAHSFFVRRDLLPNPSDRGVPLRAPRKQSHPIEPIKPRDTVANDAYYVDYDPRPRIDRYRQFVDVSEFK
jgi:hypothetical protein